MNQSNNRSTRVNASAAPASSDIPAIAGSQHVCFEGLLLPPIMRPRQVERTFALGHGVLYSHLNTGRIKSVALRDNPKQKRSTRLVYTRSVIEFLDECKEQSGAKGGL